MNCKSLVIAFCLSTLVVCGPVHAGIAIDGKEYKQTIPVTEENFTDADGWLLPLNEKNILNSRDAVPNEDGTFTVRFNCGKNAVNNLETTEPLFGFAWRTYGSSYMVRAGRWNPIDSLVKE